MIRNEAELTTTLDRIHWFQRQITQLRKTEASPVNYRAAVSGFVAELDRMQLDVREYVTQHPSDAKEAT